MRIVHIYTETSIKNPSVKDGKYASALVFIRKNGEIEQRFVTGEEAESTYNRLTLIAIIKALKKLTKHCHVVIHTDNAYIKNISEQGTPEKWRRSEWKRAGGGEVQNRELWQLYLEETKEHEIEFRFCKEHEYKEELKIKLKETT